MNLLSMMHGMLQIARMRMSRVLNVQNFSTLLHVVDTTEKSVHVLERDVARLGHDEDNESSEEQVDAGEEVEGVEGRFGEEDGEELVEDEIGDVLPLRAHADGLGTDLRWMLVMR